MIPLGKEERNKQPPPKCSKKICLRFCILYVPQRQGLIQTESKSVVWTWKRHHNTQANRSNGTLTSGILTYKDQNIFLSAMLSISLSNAISVYTDTEVDRMMEMADWSSRSNPIRLCCCCCGDGASNRCWKNSPTVIAIVLLWWRQEDSHVFLLCRASYHTKAKIQQLDNTVTIFDWILININFLLFESEFG